MIPADQTLVYILIFILAAIVLVGIALAVSYATLFAKYKGIKEEMLRRQEKEAENFQKSFEEAKRQSLLILQEAQTSAKEIVSKGQIITNNTNTDLLKLVNDNLRMQKSSYDQALSIISENVKKSFDEMPDDVKKQVEQEVQKLIQVVQQDLIQLKDSIQTSLKEPFTIAQIEAEQYKKDRMKVYDEKLFELLSHISKEVLRKELTLSEHEKLVIKALEDLQQGGEK